MSSAIAFAAYIVGLLIGLHFGFKYGFMRGHRALWMMLVAQLKQKKGE